MSALDHRTTVRVASCEGKVRFGNPRHAETAAKRSSRAHEKPFMTYRCEWCRGWHVAEGRSKERRR